MHIEILQDSRLAGDPALVLKRDTRTGIAWVEDGHRGIGHSAHPNISATGNLSAHCRRHGLDKSAFKRSHGWQYDTSSCVVSDDLDRIAASHCRCGGNHGDIPHAE